MAPFGSFLTGLFRASSAVALLMISVHAPALAEKRVAYILGNSAYTRADVLPNTVSDARATAAMFRKLGFTVQEVLDADAATLRRSLVELENQLQDSDLAVFYYAGHGMSIDGVNYIFPVDADLKSEADIKKQLVSVNDVIDMLQTYGRQTLVFLDACRNNPFEKQVRRFAQRSIGRGLARIGSAKRRGDRVRARRSRAVRRGGGEDQGLAEMGSDEINMYVAFATQPGNYAADGLADATNSPFTEALIEHLGERLELREMMTKVRASVVRSTSGVQIPWDQSSLTEPIFLAGKPEPKTTVRPRFGFAPPP